MHPGRSYCCRFNYPRFLMIIDTGSDILTKEASYQEPTRKTDASTQA